MASSMIHNLSLFIRRHRLDIALIGILLLVSGIPRLVHLGVFLTADEKNWIGRSYEFVRAFKDFRFNDMLQTTHPGVTVLWIVGLAVSATVAISHTPFSFSNLIHFVWVSQFVVALTNTLLIAAVYLFLRKLLPTRRWAFIAALCISLDPFLVGYSRVAHVDALLASFLFLTCVGLIIWAKEQFSRPWLIISSVCFALALLTKVPAIFAVPFFWLVVLTFKPTILWHRHVLKERFKDFLTWLLLASLIFLLVWPALLWVPNPQGNALVLKRDVVVALSTPHDMTEEYSLNAWFYPAVLLTRTTPMAFIFSVLCIGITIWQISRYKRTNSFPKESFLLIGYVVFFVLMMTLGGKKGDRYILAVFPAISLLMVIGIQHISRLVSRSQLAQKKIAYGISSFVIAYLLSTNMTYHPYVIAYSNPFLPDNLSQELGWGEGLDQVAAWFNTYYPSAVVASWYPDELGAFTSAHVAHINAHEQFNVQFVVLYHNMFGRAADNPANDFIDEYYKKKVPVFVAYVAQKEFAWVYEKRVYTEILPELTADKRVEQLAEVSHPNLAGLDILLATYTNRANRGIMHVLLRDGLEGKVLYEWKLPVNEIKDTQYTTLLLPTPLTPSTKKVSVELFTEGASMGNAPTVRYTTKHVYREDAMRVDGVEKVGNVGLRLRYALPNSQSATEEDTKLLLN